jgi:hypothetical protein|tara:strand:+ start:534 stop:869 length:336 start_codon:yes stop_codon:yes gene_type:complete
MKYQDTTITITREEEIRIHSIKDLWVRVGFSIDAEMTAEEPRTYEHPGCPAEVNQWLNLTIADLEYYGVGGNHTLPVKPAEMPRYILSFIHETILELAEDAGGEWIDEAIL